MNLNVKIFTIDKKKAITAKDIARIKDVLARVQGLGVVNIQVERIKTTPKITPSGRIDWQWFANTLTAQAEGYNCVAFHFPRVYRRKWKMLPNIGGSYRNDLDSTLEFWFTADKGQKAKGYKEDTEVTRLFLHELLHGFKRKYGGNSNDVHIYDYTMKDVAIGYFTVKL